ncbi:MAG TPA: hypothetical protein VFM83_09290 [Gaiellaceae bacterium]|nr:hypothetical protein [Gaiellaceae bacterium]
MIGRGRRAPRLLLGAIGASDAASGAFASAASLTARWCRGFFASIVHFAYHRAPGAARPDREPGM